MKQRRIAVRGIVIDDVGKLFCVRLKAYGGKTENEFWCLPGGGVDIAEPLLAALHREMIEETGVAPEIGELLYVQQYYDQSHLEEQLELFFHIKNFNDYKNLDLSKASHAEEEIMEHGFVDPKTTYILPEFLTTDDLAAHIKGAGPAKIVDNL